MISLKMYAQAPSDTIMQKNDFILQQKHIDAYIQFNEFLILQPLTLEEKQKVKEEVMEFTRQDENQVKKDLNFLESFAQRTQTISDYSILVNLRQNVIEEMSEATTKDNGEEYLIIQLLNKHNPTLTVGVNGILLMKKPLDALMNSAEFLYQLADEKLENKEGTKQYILENFKNLAPTVQVQASYGYYTNLLIQEKWNNVPQEKQQEVKNNIKKLIQNIKKQQWQHDNPNHSIYLQNPKNQTEIQIWKMIFVIMQAPQHLEIESPTKNYWQTPDY